MDAKGKVVVVTGATSGLGQAAAIDLAKRGARVLVVGRDAARANETLEQMKKAGGDGEVILGDVSTVAGARKLARAILEKAPRLDVLINNAGGTFKTESKTAEGIETTFALNTLGAFVLEKELHGALAAAKGRVVNLATGFLDSFPVEVDELVAPKKYAGLAQYGRSKQASVMMTVEQAKRYAAEGVSAVSLHPGVIMGTRFGGGQPKVMQLLAGPLMRLIGLGCTLEEAQRRFFVAAFGDVPNGSYIVNGKPAELPKQVKDEAVRAKVYSLLEKLAVSPSA
ncbi:SDR family NAD(P)-dependent oxidoreductase [Archangium sp.]|uniref:SDR family NAD(P)-dependent oxidoreductase n=1 Tax=Archangium sp. TaxID=1872627 RepID=UPI00389A4978